MSLSSLLATKLIIKRITTIKIKSPRIVSWPTSDSGTCCSLGKHCFWPEFRPSTKAACILNPALEGLSASAGRPCLPPSLSVGLASPAGLALFPHLWPSHCPPSPALPSLAFWVLCLPLTCRGPSLGCFSQSPAHMTTLAPQCPGTQCWALERGHPFSLRFSLPAALLACGAQPLCAVLCPHRTPSPCRISATTSPTRSTSTSLSP